jgi:hypothetical protein
VLPAGRSRLSFTYAETTPISDTFDQNGERVSLTQNYNLPINAQTIEKANVAGLSGLIKDLNALPLKYNPQAKDSYNGITTSSTAGGQNLGDALTDGNLGTGAEIVEKQYNVSYQYGVTDRLSVGFNIPIISAQVNFNAGLSGTNTTQNIAAAFNQPGMKNRYGALAAQLNSLANQNVSTLRTLVQQQVGYTVPPQSNQSGIGDVVIGGRYNYYKSRYEDIISSVQAGLSLPTGSVRDPSIPTQISLGTGAFDIGVAHIFNYSPFRFLTLSNGIHYDHRLPSHMEMIPSIGDQSLPPVSNEENVATQLGDKYWTNFGMDFKITSAFTMNTSYEWFWKRPDKFSGSTPGVDYGGMSVDTQEYVETAQAGASLSTIPAFLKKEFPIPLDIAMNVYVPTRGVNAVISPYATASISMYF